MNRDRLELSLELIDGLLEDGAIHTAQSEIRSLRSQIRRKQTPGSSSLILSPLQKKILAIAVLWVIALILASFIAGGFYSCHKGGGTMAGGMTCTDYELVYAEERDGQLYKVQDYSIANITIPGVRYAD